MPDSLDDIRLAVLTRAPEPVRSWSMDAVLIVACNAIVAAAVMVFVAWSRHPRAGDLSWWLGAIALGVTSVGCSVLALRPGKRHEQLYGVALACLPSLVLLSTTRTAGHGFFDDAECALAEVAVSLVPGLLAAYVLTRLAYQPLRALNGGFAVAVTGLLVLHLTCARADTTHVLVFHIAPYVAVALLVVALRTRLRTRSFAP